MPQVFRPPSAAGTPDVLPHQGAEGEGGAPHGDLAQRHRRPGAQLHRGARPVLRQGRPNDPKALVFGSSNGSMKRGYKFWENLQKACDRAGVERIRWHDLRHHFASQCMAEFCETKEDLWKVTKLMGHSTIAMTQTRYGHWFDEEGENTEDVDRLSARMTFNRKDPLRLV